MQNRIAVVVTSIAAPNDILYEIARGCEQHRYSFYVVGDVSSPADFQLTGCNFFSIDRQRQLGFLTAQRSPERHYARKNIGYLQAIRDGASLIVETDDDNLPRPEFWRVRSRVMEVPQVSGQGWVNVYRYFTDQNIWPRGLPLQFARAATRPFETCPIRELDCPIQQSLADDNPDVDAIYRLILPLPVQFRRDRALALGPGAWCPFNSQNTAFWPDAYPLLYLPAHCSFRMTDIWRSFIAQRICWENNWSVLFHGPTVIQQRNYHDLMRDFRDELPGYLQNAHIREILESLSLRAGQQQIGENMRKCYQALVCASIIPEAELELLDAWIQDLALLHG